MKIVLYYLRLIFFWERNSCKCNKKISFVVCFKSNMLECLDSTEFREFCFFFLFILFTVSILCKISFVRNRPRIQTVSTFVTIKAAWHPMNAVFRNVVLSNFSACLDSIIYPHCLTLTKRLHVSTVYSYSLRLFTKSSSASLNYCCCLGDYTLLILHFRLWTDKSSWWFYNGLIFFHTRCST